MKKIKIIVFVVLTLVVLVGSGKHAKIKAEKLSEIGYARQIQFLADNDVDVPDEYLEKESFPTFLNSVFTYLETDEDYPFAFNSATLNMFIEDVRNAFKANRDLFVDNVSMLHAQRPISSLRESLVYKNGEWVS